MQLRNNPDESLVEDLINLPYLHEPSILYTLEKRYDDGAIYTYTGPILIAVNPFKQLPLYTAATLEMYYNHGLAKSQGLESGLPLAPHVYAIADNAYRGMMTAIFDRRNDSADQSILISGESGAGKTESTKIVLRYLTALGNDRSEGSVFDVSSGSIMDQILQSNPILEAFGNARTLRNDNSSRFGKFIELHFNNRGNLVGGVISTYLLEKVRLPAQNKGERNFHIFYQLMKGLTDDEKSSLFLDKRLEDYWYTQQGGIYHMDSIDDAKDFVALRQALSTLNFTEENRKEIVSCSAAILLLGQVSFMKVHASGHEEDSCSVSSDPGPQEAFTRVSSLFGVDKDELQRILTEKEYFIGGQTFHRPFTVSQAVDARDAVAKGIYGRLFNWIVKVINKTIEVEAKSVMARIGVLDIFGFECFQTNSFEQLAINYTNESLQQQFNQYVFKIEQEVYKHEQIEWSFIEFPDNQDCLDLIEHRQNGIFALLNDECKLPKANDQKLASRMYVALKDHDRFSASNKQQRDGTFEIRHYAGSVIYSVDRFVEKNRDDVPKELESLFQQSTVSLLGEIFGLEKDETSGGRSTPRRRSVFFTPTRASGGDGEKGVRAKTTTRSVSTEFKVQLHALLERIYTTKPHYIRCLKPNDENVPEKLDRRRTTEQLRYGGVLEAVRVARSGYPVRLTHADFHSRYRILSPPSCSLPGNGNGEVTREFCVEFMESLVSTADESEDLVTSVQIGVTKVFMRKNAHDSLEGKRSRRLIKAVCTIQALVRAMNLRRAFKAKRSAVRLIQRVYRGSVGRHVVAVIRAQNAVLRIQTWWRTSIASLRFHMSLLAAVLLQRVVRGHLGREKLRAEKQYLRRVVCVQSRFRVRCAKRLLVVKRKEAKSIGRLQESNDALKQEIQKLREVAVEEARKARETAILESSQGKDELIERLTGELDSVKCRLDDELKRRTAAERALGEAREELRNVLEERSSAPVKLLSSTEASTTSPRPLITDVGTNPRQSLVESDKGDNELLKELESERALRADLEEELARLRAAWINKQAQESVEEVSGDLVSAGGAAVVVSNGSRLEGKPSPSSKKAGEEPTKDKERKPPVFGKGHLLKKNGGVVPRRGSRTSATPGPKPDSDGTDSRVSEEDNRRAHMIAYQKNIEQFKRILSKGQRAHVYEHNLISRDATVVYASPDTLLFVPAKPSWLFFSSPVKIASIRISDIIEVTAGARSGFHNMTAADDARCLNIDVHVQFEAPRSVIFKLSDRIERNKILTALRSLMKDAQMNVPAARTDLLLDTPAKQLFSPGGEKSEATDNIDNTPPPAPLVNGDPPAMNSIVDTQEKRASMTAFESVNASSPHDLSVQYGKTLIKVREQEEELTRMRKREAEYERDARVRVQLSRRLESVLLDRQGKKNLLSLLHPTS